MTLCRLRAARTSESKSPSKIPSVHASYVAAPAKGVNTTTARRRSTLSLRLTCILSRVLDNWGPHKTKLRNLYLLEPVLAPLGVHPLQILLGGDRAGRELVLSRRIDADFGRGDGLPIGGVRIFGHRGIESHPGGVPVDVDVLRRLDVPGHRPEHLEVVAHVDVVVDNHHPLRPRRVIGPHRPH